MKKTVKKNVQALMVFFVLMTLSINGLHAQDCLFTTRPETEHSNNIRNYLMVEANEITKNSLCNIHSIEGWEQVKKERYRELTESLGLIDVPLFKDRPDLNVKVTGKIKMDGYSIEKLYYESLPSLYVPANLYIPENINEPAPAILYLCGHSDGQKVAYQGYARKFAQLGFVCLIVETVQLGEVRGVHHGCYAKGWFNWYSRGYTPAGVEVWNAIRGLDLLSQRKEVDAEKLGVTGRSGGGAQTWFVAAIDERVKAAAPGVGATTMNEQILTRSIDGHCDCMVPINTFQRDFSDIGALIAPRALYIDQGNRDRLTTVEGVRKLYSDIKKIYGLYKLPEEIHFLEYKGGHGSTTYSRQQMYSFFLEELMDKKMRPEEIGDPDFSPESELNLSAEKLRVYENGAPEDDRTLTIQDSFIKPPAAPEIHSKDELATHSDSVLEYLKENTFGAFPETPVPFDPHLIFRSMDRDNFGSNVYSFVPEEGWRLRADVRWKLNPENENPLLIVLKKKGDQYSTAEDFAESLEGDWNIAYINLRGIDQSGWEDGLQWHIRRASAWTGRTIASMQVYDLLRSIEFCRSLPGVDDNHISIAAREELGAIALYAGLLDGNIDELILRNPPESQDEPSQPDGGGTAIEMLNCLRVTDLWQIPALIPQTDIRFLDEVPEAYSWSEDVRIKTGSSDYTITAGNY